MPVRGVTKGGHWQCQTGVVYGMLSMVCVRASENWPSKSPWPRPSESGSAIPNLPRSHGMKISEKGRPGRPSWAERIEMSGISRKVREPFGQTWFCSAAVWLEAGADDLIISATRSQSMDFSQIVYAKAGGVATITFNRPDRLNAFTWTMHREMREAIIDAEADDSVGAVVVTGA